MVALDHLIKPERGCTTIFLVESVHHLFQLLEMQRCVGPQVFPAVGYKIVDGLAGQVGGHERGFEPGAGMTNPQHDILNAFICGVTEGLPHQLAQINHRHATHELRVADLQWHGGHL